MTTPLRLIHARESLRPSSFEHWSRQETAEIVTTLSPGSAAPLLVDDDGTVMDGNTRIYVMKDRGYDVDVLPRTPYRP